eukprot:94873-Prymnesium_polylepis.1
MTNCCHCASAVALTVGSRALDGPSYIRVSSRVLKLSSLLSEPSRARLLLPLLLRRPLSRGVALAARNSS